jgi:hypothetical protein
MVNEEQVEQIASMLTDDPDILNEIRTLPKGSWGAAVSGKGRSCPSCGAPSDPGDKQCDSCGNMINWAGSSKRGYEAQALRCPKCGGGWEQGQKACQQCGTVGRPVSAVA